MQESSFVIEVSDVDTCWAELDDSRVKIHRTPHSSSGRDEVLLDWEIDVLRNLLTWSGQGGVVVATFTGPFAHQIQQQSRELGMTPEMFVWHAVKVFIEVGTGT